MHLKPILVLFLCFGISLLSCSLMTGRNTKFFKETKAYELAKAVENGNLKKTERLVKKDPSLLEVTNPISGSNVLALCLYVEQFESFEKLLQLGADPNFTNPYTNYSILINSIMPFGSSSEWIKDNRYAKTLLEYGADPNYSVDKDFVNEKGHYISATSPLIKASSLNLDLVKLLVSHGANPYSKLIEDQRIPFASSVSASKFDIINYYIDSLNVDVLKPMRVVVRKPENIEVTYYIQDYIKRFMSYKEGSEGYKKREQLISKLENMGVDFENYEYKL